MSDIFTKFTLKRLLIESKPFIKEVAIVFAVFLIAYMSYTYSNNESDALLTEKKRAVQTLDQINSNIKSVNNAMILWEDLKRELHTRNGLDIETFRLLVETIKGRHAINDFSVKLTNPVVRGDFKDKKYIQLEYSTIEMNFNAVTDVDAYRFLKEMIQSVPGILQIERFDFKVTKELNAKTLLAIKEGKIKDTVKVSIQLKWHNIIDIK